MHTSKPMPPLEKSELDRFNKYVRKGQADACWPWQGPRNQLGYGQLRYWRNGRAPSGIRRCLAAHRVALYLHTGEDRHGYGEVVMHSCDNPSCCNPRHLSYGSELDNVADCFNKGRVAWGEQKKHKLTVSIVKALRKKYHSLIVPKDDMLALMKRFNVAEFTIRHAVNGRKWRRVGEQRTLRDAHTPKGNKPPSPTRKQ